MNRDERSTFALRLRLLRKKAHMTQADVAAALNLHRTAYTKYETDKACPDHVCLLMLADLFHVTVDYLLGKDTSEIFDGFLDNPTVVTLSPEEAELVTSFRKLTEAQRTLLIQTERELLGTVSKEV